MMNEEVIVQGGISASNRDDLLDLVYDNKTMSYKSRHQQEEIDSLKEQLKKDTEKRKRDIDTLIAHYYKP